MKEKTLIMRCDEQFLLKVKKAARDSKCLSAFLRKAVGEYMRFKSVIDGAESSGLKTSVIKQMISKGCL